MKRQHIVTALAVLTIGVPLAARQQQTTPPSQEQRQPTTSAAQQREERPTTVARFYNLEAKDGHAMQLEEGIKKHMAWHRAAGDTGSWHVWNIATGPMMGNYNVGTLGRTWKGLEQTDMGAKDQADVTANITPHVESVSGTVWIYRGDISPAAEQPPSPLALVIHYYLRPEGVRVFENAIRQVTGAMMKLPEGERANPPMIYELMAGGEGPRLAMVFSADGWGDLAPRGNSPLQALEKAFGADKAGEIMRTGGQTIRHMESEILRYRPDLSSPAESSASARPQ